MPHPIPDSPELIDGWRYYLVALPDDDVAVSAGWAIYSELINNWAWGLEGIEPDSPTMAQVWAGAVYETLRLADMSILEQIFGAIDEVEGLLQLIADKEAQGGDAEAINDSICCDGVVAPVADTTGSDIVRDVGDPPGGIVDWPTYDQKLCEAALNYANNLTEWVDTMQALSALTTLGLALALAGLVGGLAAVGIAGAAAVGAMGVLEALGFLNKVIGVFTPSPGWGDARSQLQSATTIDAIACAIINAPTPAIAETAVDAALLANAPDAYDIFEPWPLRFTMNKIFNMESDAGGYGGATCPECAAEPMGAWDWGNNDNGWDSWTNLAGASLDTTYMYRFTYGSYVSRSFAVAPGAHTITIILSGRNQAAGTANVRITANDGGGGPVLDTDDNAMLELDQQEHTYTLDISGKTQNNIIITIAKTSGDTAGRTPIYYGSGEYV